MKRIARLIFSVVFDMLVTIAVVKTVDRVIYRRKPIGFASLKK